MCVSISRRTLCTWLFYDTRMIFELFSFGVSILVSCVTWQLESGLQHFVPDIYHPQIIQEIPWTYQHHNDRKDRSFRKASSKLRIEFSSLDSYSVAKFTARMSQLVLCTDYSTKFINRALFSSLTLASILPTTGSSLVLIKVQLTPTISSEPSL